jgi:glycosyltransferase involved in cell wall biosynthesis
MDSGNGRTSPVRVLHVLDGMNRCGLETWLMHVLRHIDRDRFRMDFLVHKSVPCAYDDEIRSLGSEVIPCLHPSRPWTYARNFKRILRELGPYDVVHSHVHHFSGLVLRVAGAAGVPIRIAHSHNDTSRIQAGAGSLRRAYLALMNRWMARYSTARLAVSRQAAEALFGTDRGDCGRYRVLYLGIDLEPFQHPADRDAVRAELGIPSDAFVIGHVGRFAPQKNHAFLVEIFGELVRREPSAHLLLVGGEGELRPAVERQLARAGLAERVVFTGSRPDVPRLMLGAMDVFLFPSRFEGLGLVLVEAQAVGLPCVISDVVPEEADVVPGLVRRMSLAQPAEVWAEALIDSRSKVMTPSVVLQIIEKSPFGIGATIAGLEEVYSG